MSETIKIADEIFIEVNNKKEIRLIFKNSKVQLKNINNKIIYCILNVYKEQDETIRKDLLERIADVLIQYADIMRHKD